MSPSLQPAVVLYNQIPETASLLILVDLNNNK